MADPPLPPGFTLDQPEQGQGAGPPPPPGFTPDAQAAQDQPPADAAPDGSGFTDEQKHAIHQYIAQAKDPADLERFSLEVSGGRSRIGNAKQVLEEFKKGTHPNDFGWAVPTIAKEPPKSDIRTNEPLTLDHIRQAIGDAMMNVVAPGLGSVINAGAQDSGSKALVEHTANSLAFDYGPEVGGLIDTILHPSSDLDRSVAHERAILQGDSEGHPIASIAGELGGTAVNAMLGNEAGVANLGRVGRGLATAGEGAAYGSGAAGPGHRVEGAITGAALGTATEAAVAGLAARQAAKTAARSAIPTVARDAASAASDLNVDLPRFVVGGSKDAKKAAALEQTAMGSGPISEATGRMIEQSRSARAAVADNLGSSAVTDAQLGDQALNAAVGQNKRLRAAGGRLYDQARTAAADTTIAPDHTLATIDGLLAEENGKIGGSKIAPILQSYRDDLAKAGRITVQQARDLRTDLRETLSTDAAATPDKTDRIVGMVMGGVNDDMHVGLLADGKPDALALFREADANWAQQRQLEDEVLKPFLGKNFDNWGDDVAKKIYSDASGNGTRLARFLSALPEDEANNVRATLVNRLGTARKGAQNAAGDAFSLDTFLTNWNEMKGARKLVFDRDTVQSLDKLAKIAQVAKSYGQKTNRSNTGGVVSYLLHGTPTLLGSGGAILSHDPHVLVYGLLGTALTSVRQRTAAKLLASPAFAKKLAATPLNASGATAFWSRPWVKAMAVKNPAIAGEIQAFQHAFLSHANDNSGIVSSAVASPDADQ